MLLNLISKLPLHHAAINNMNQLSNSKKHSHGFTLVESLVAISILIIGVLGPITLATRNISDGLYVKNKLTALYLATEALELLTYKKSLNIANDPDFWNLGMNPDVNPYYISFETGNLSFCTPGLGGHDDCQLVFDTDSGSYLSLSEAAAPSGLIFTRKVYITEINPGIEISAKVVVSWFDKNVAKSLELTKHLFKTTK